MTTPADEIAKLAALRDQGALSAEQFEAEKRRVLGQSGQAPKVIWYKRRSYRIVTVILAIVILAYHLFGKSDGLPKCGSSVAVTTLKKAIDQSQFARNLNLSAIDIEGVKETSFDEAVKRRTCEASVTFNNTEKAPIDYRLDGRPSGQFMIEFRLRE